MSSAERMRIALTEKRDILGAMIAWSVSRRRRDEALLVLCSTSWHVLSNKEADVVQKLAQRESPQSRTKNAEECRNLLKRLWEETKLGLESTTTTLLFLTKDP